MENLQEAPEVWVNLYTYSGYQLSDKGKIRSTDRTISVTRNGVTYDASYTGKEKASRHTKKNGHYFVDVFPGVDENKNKIQKTIYIHRAVADHFVEKTWEQIEYEIKGGTLFASFIERDFTKCNKENIKWVTKKELTIQEQTTKKNKGLIKSSAPLNWNV